MKKRGLSLLLFLALTSACGSNDTEGGSGGVGSGGKSGSGGSGGVGSGGKSGGSGGTGAIDPGGPLLERPPGTKYGCSISRPITRLNLPWDGFALVPNGGQANLAVVAADRNNPDPNRAGNSITWSSLALDGTLGPKSVVRAPTNRYLNSVTAANGGEKSTIVFSEASADGTSYSVNSLQVNAEGAVVTEASVLSRISRGTPLKLVRAGSGYALFWVDGTETSSTLKFGLLDESGKLSGTPVGVASGTYLAVGDIAPVSDHFLVSYADYGYAESGLVNRLLVLGADGSVSGEPLPLENSSANGFSGTIPSLLVRGDEVLAAWSVVTGDASYEAQRAATTVRIARFDQNGERKGSMYDLQAPVEDRENVQPVWVEVGQDVGLLWAEGNIIYICAGCVPNHSLKFVVLDGETFEPRSNVAHLANTLPSGGLLSPKAARSGDELLIVSSVTYHTSAEGASGALRCAP